MKLLAPMIVVMFAFRAAFTAGAGDQGASANIRWYTIESGGGRSIGGIFSVTGTIGQPDASLLTGGDFVLSGGFWPGATKVEVPDDCRPDGIIDVADVPCFVACAHGPGRGYEPGCEIFDFDRDFDVDLVDFGRLQSAFDQSGLVTN